MTDTTDTDLRTTLDRAAELHELYEGACGTCADADGQAAAWPCETAAALAVARQVLGTTTGQPETAPWPPVSGERPDHELYTLLRKTGLDPDAAQQMIDTYTRTILTGQPTPCGPVPDACDAEAGDPCANHEREQAHEEGEHAFCGAKCATGQPETAPTVTRAEVLREAADHAESLRQFEHATGARWSAQVSENVGILRVADSLRHLAAEAQQPTPAPAEADGCWCGHPQDRHFTSQVMTLPNGCHDCQGWNGAHAYGQDLPWAAIPAPAEETK